MKKDNKVFRLKGKVQHYAWGGFDYIPGILSVSNPDKKPFAEYWMGAHENAPSRLEVAEGEAVALDKYIGQDPEERLGEYTFSRFGRLPYLLKILDVKDMLSIQVHPTKKNAEIEFAAENKKGVAPNAPDRNYKDDNHKPELMLALSEFWLLHGFKPLLQLQKLLAEVRELRFLIPILTEGSYKELYRKVMEMPQEEVNTVLQPLLDRILPLYESGELEED
ncbi:mannose-6-phosphate isomerase, class I [Puia sp. P3]|uniref:mannose-6-phosphate isomerase, class I n=1 Tax=Puia sp. P3 TaxID=3423952 RepID=UPI003D672DFB